MPTADDYRRALEVVTTKAVADAIKAARLADTADSLTDLILALIALYSDATATLGVDHYDDARDIATATQRFRSEPIVNLREEKIVKGVQWAAGPMYGDYPDVVMGEQRLGEVVQLETARPFRDTVLTNSDRDPSSVGWRRNLNPGACKFCRMIAGNGSVYRESTARFASHPSCYCSASPVFDGDAGPEASVLQYTASLKHKTPSQKQKLNAYLASLPD